MSQSNPERVRRALEIFKKGFAPFVERQMVHLNGSFQPPEGHLDAQALLRIMLDNWDNVFREILGTRRRRILDRVRIARNNWAHQDLIELTDVYHLLENIQDLLTCISARQEAREIDQLRQEIEREQAEDERLHEGKTSRPASSRPPYADKSRYEEAVEAFDHTLQVDPKNDRASRRRRKTFSQQQNQQRRVSESGYRESVVGRKERTYPPLSATSNRLTDTQLQDFIQLWTKIAKKAMVERRYQEAVDAWDRVIQADPHISDAYLNKASVMIELGRFQGALKALNQASQINSTGSLQSNRAYALIMLKRFPEALEASNQAIQLDPSNSHAFVNKGAALNGLGEYQEAEDAFNRAIRLDPNNVPVYRNLGYSLLKLKKFQQALNVLNWAIQLNPNDSASFVNRDAVLKELERY